jgi:nicotinate-nucleotide pyrophosphorylase (carboxylating)
MPSKSFYSGTVICIQMDLRDFLDEDIGSGDITTEALLGNEEATGVIIAKERCVLAGLEEAKIVFEQFGLQVKLLAADGQVIKKPGPVLTITGKAHAILKGERTALNIIMRMSGVATKTRAIVDKCRPVNPNIIVACTRKTTPGFRFFEKKAVFLGGGDTHRYGLDDAILIKDNHLKVLGSVKKALEKAKARSKELLERSTDAPDFAKGSFAYQKIEIEVEDLAGAKEAAKAGADIIMLDNFKPKDAAKAYKAVKQIDPDILVEVSGGMNEKNVLLYARNADVISFGSLTHSYKSIDFSLELEFVLPKKR